MNASRIAAGCAAVMIVGQGVSAAEVWRTGGFQGPETVLLDPGRQRLYVSNVAGEPLGKDGAGFISIVGTDGSLQELEWVSGFDAPKGMALAGDTLFVADIDRLVAIDIEKGEISGSWPAEGAVFLNDVAVDADGRVFVSDMATDRIYVLDGDSMSVWLEGEGLMHPNGLDLEDGTLFISGWGAGLKDDFSTEVPGHVVAVDLATGDIGQVGSGAPVGNLDGLEAEGTGSWLVTDWIGGGLWRVAPDGTPEQLADLPQGSANLEFLDDAKLAIVPMMLDGEIVAHSID